MENRDLSTGLLGDIIRDLVSGAPIPWVSGMRKGWSHCLWDSVFAPKNITMEEGQEDCERRGADVCSETVFTRHDRATAHGNAQ